MSPRPVLLLDVMSTLVTEPFHEAVPAHFDMTMDELLGVKDRHAWIEFEHGRIDEAEYARRFFRDRRPVDVEAFKRAMQDAYELMDGVEALLAELKSEGYRMYALSNYSPWFRLIEDKLRLSRFLGWDFVSCLTGHRKPDPEAYLVACRALDVPPEQCLFVDDRDQNVAGAEAVGMRGLTRRAPIDAFRADLKAAGIRLA